MINIRQEQIEAMLMHNEEKYLTAFVAITFDISPNFDEQAETNKNSDAWFPELKNQGDCNG